MAVMSVFASSGKIVYPAKGGGTGSAIGGGGGGGSGGTGGVRGGGGLWSAIGQIIWLQLDSGVKYPVYVHPGWNEVYFWIPNIYPEDVWIEAPLIIEAPGYILIPAGFEWDIITEEGAPEKLANQRMFDGLKFVDTYDIDIITPSVPVDLDGLIDDLSFEDFVSSEILNVTISELDNIETLTFEDIHQLEIQLPPFSGETESIEDTGFEDVVNTELINTTITNSPSIEDTGFEDVVSTEIE